VMTIALPRHDMTAGSTALPEYLVRSALFLLCFLLVTLTPAPFPNLGDPKLLEPVGDGSLFGQVVMVGLTGVLSLFLLAKAPRLVRHAITPALIILFGWIVLTAALSPHPELALRRSVLAAFTVANAIAFVLLPEGRRHFAWLLAIGTLVVLATCYVGVLLFPQVSIHQATDVIEYSLAGAWRGAFGHKNGAGASTVVFIFIGIFGARAASRFAGLTIIVASSVFLFFTMSKSPVGLLPVAAALAYLVLNARRPAAKWALLIATVLIVNLLTIGTVAIEPIHKLLIDLMPDSTFTGRDEIWQFAIDRTLDRPIMGFGFQAFWGSPEMVLDWAPDETWALRASDAHNAYANLSVMIGLVGLALALAWIVAQPLGDLIADRRKAFDPALTMLFAQVWLLGLCLSGTESVLLGGGDFLWFMMIVSIVGLRLQRFSRLGQ
ncbi:MAG: O-antigen ligase family protein, partial [Alphaproteobacteria bacterium]|nr:O-antigen ligase family protein [Alphaproteobacteria bacterium]